METDELHPVAWVAWLAAAALPALLTRNPLYLALALAAAGITYMALDRGGQAGRGWTAFVRFGALLWLFTIPFTLLTSHYGNLVLVQLPASWPIVGGPLTAESLLYGLCSGLVLITLLLAFAAFNVAVDQARLLRMTPGFVYQAGVIAAIAVAFVPQMVASWQSIREAQEMRGHRVRGLRDTLPLLLPLLVTALERAMQLAESMEARGFGRQLQPVTRGRRASQQLALLAGLVALAVGLAGTGFWPGRPALNVALLAAGAGLMVFSLWDQGRRVLRTHYRRWRWTPAGRGLLAASALIALAWLAAWLLHAGSLIYYPYPPYSPWPAFDPWLGLLAASGFVPALLLPARQRTAEAGPAAEPATRRAAHPSAQPAARRPAPGLARRVTSLVLRVLTALLLLGRRP